MKEKYLVENEKESITSVLSGRHIALGGFKVFLRGKLSGCARSAKAATHTSVRNIETIEKMWRSKNEFNVNSKVLKTISKECYEK